MIFKYDDPPPRVGDRHRPRVGDRHFRPSARGRFVGVDGEGWGSTYALLADSGGHELVRPQGISSVEAFHWLSHLPYRNGKAVFVGFALGYDINHWLRDLPDMALYRLWKKGYVRWEDWWLQWAPRRWFHLKHLPSKRSVRIWDSFPFFQGSFLKACGDWGVDVPESVRQGKAARATFTPADLPQIAAYNREELTTLVTLLRKLKDGLYGAGITLDQWYGAGAIATWLMSHNEGKSKIAVVPSAVREAALGAYFGGRVEAGRTGHIEGPIENIDLKSAYPDAMRTLPNLARGRWEQVDLGGIGDKPSSTVVESESEMAVYLLEWEFPQGCPYYPLPWRSKEEAIYFPRVGRGWYWAPEVGAAIATAESGGSVEVLDGWRFLPTDPHERAFPWVEGLYNKRQEVGPKSGAGLSLKLGLNALYGKTSQRTGLFGRIPTFRQYEYAGYATSYVRARLWGAAMGALDSVIAFATDGIYSTEVLTPVSDWLKEDLGAWASTTYTEGDWVMAGVYRVRKPDGTWELFGRGYGKGGVPWDRVLRGWADNTPKLTVTTPHLWTLGECIHTRKGVPRVDRKKWRSWTEEEKELRLKEPSLKRLGALPFDPCFGVPVLSTPYGGVASKAVSECPEAAPLGRPKNHLL